MLILSAFGYSIKGLVAKLLTSICTVVKTVSRYIIIPAFLLDEFEDMGNQNP